MRHAQYIALLYFTEWSRSLSLFTRLRTSSGLPRDFLYRPSGSISLIFFTFQLPQVCSSNWISGSARYNISIVQEHRLCENIFLIRVKLLRPCYILMIPKQMSTEWKQWFLESNTWRNLQHLPVSSHFFLFSSWNDVMTSRKL